MRAAILRGPADGDKPCRTRPLASKTIQPGKRCRDEQQIAGSRSIHRSSGNRFCVLSSPRRSDLFGLDASPERRIDPEHGFQRQLTLSHKDWSESLLRFQSSGWSGWRRYLCRASRVDQRPLGTAAESRSEGQQLRQRLLPIRDSRREQTHLCQQSTRWPGPRRLLHRLSSEHDG